MEIIPIYTVVDTLSLTIFESSSFHVEFIENSIAFYKILKHMNVLY